MADPRAAAPAHDPHYLRDVTSLGDTREVVTRTAVFTRNGIKLVEKGVRVDSRLYERLMRHTLKPPLEQCLTVADPVGRGALREQAEQLLASERGYAALRDAGARPGDLLAALAAAPLEDSLAVRLTVMRERRPPMFEHAVGVALIACALARRAGSAGGELSRVAGAGLYHDLGEMHLDPALLDQRRPLTDAERRHIYTHPLTSFLILQESGIGRGAIAEAAFEHHERLDGSGYPRGIHGEEQGTDGRLLAVAELAAAFFSSPLDKGDLRRLPVVFKLNHRRFDRAVVSQLLVLAQPGAQGAAAADAAAAAGARLKAIEGVLQEWRALRATGAAGGEALAWAAERITLLERSMIEAGLDLADADALVGSLGDDPEALEEVPAAARELAWLIEEIARNLLRRPDLDEAGPIAEWARLATQRLAVR